MKLIHKVIPGCFLHALPDGIKRVRKGGRDFLVVEDVRCPKGHSLMAESMRIHGESSIKVRLRVGVSEGDIFIDAFWGGHAKFYSFIPDVQSAGPIVKAFCPTCGADLVVDLPCREKGCDSRRAILFSLPDPRNKIHVCARLGCPWHQMDIANVPCSIAEKINDINYVGAQAEDIFMEI